MVKAIELAKRISAIPQTDWSNELINHNFHKIFFPVYSLAFSIEDKNKIICFIIYAYDNNSNWINLNADRLSDKINILKSLDANINETLYADILYQKNYEIQDVIVDYLISITNWKWRTIMACFDFHAVNIRIATEPTKATDEQEVAKINKAKGELLKEAIRQREVGENLLKEIKSEYVKSDRATQQDFGFEITDEKKIDPMSWRHYVKDLNNKGIKVT